MSKNKNDLTEDEVAQIRETLKKKRSKTGQIKTLTISSKSHSEVKKYCVENELKIGDWVEMVLMKEIKRKLG